MLKEAHDGRRRLEEYMVTSVRTPPYEISFSCIYTVTPWVWPPQEVQVFPADVRPPQQSGALTLSVSEGGVEAPHDLGGVSVT